MFDGLLCDLTSVEFWKNDFHEIIISYLSRENLVWNLLDEDGSKKVLIDKCVFV